MCIHGETEGTDQIEILVRLSIDLITEGHLSGRERRRLDIDGGCEECIITDDVHDRVTEREVGGVCWKYAR